jgi:hypothetical protein
MVRVEMNRDDHELRPAEYCQQALEVIQLSEERRKRRKRDTGADQLGLQIKQELLRGAIEADPDPDSFEEWLLEQVIASPASGSTRAMAMEVLADYENARVVDSFGGWLADGAPSPRIEFPGDNRSSNKRREP